ncbi:MAG: DUF2284 domain-containing protein [Synergistaceae bacterium]
MPEFIENFVDAPRFLGYCKGCCHFEKRWSCSPHNFDPVEFLNQYNDVRLIELVIKPDKKNLDGLVCKDYDVPKEIGEMIDIEKAHLTKYMRREEKQVPNSLYLFSGSCEICDECTRTQGLPCRFPDKMRYSIESLGIDLSQISEKFFGVKVEWMKGTDFPDHLTLICALLIK